MAHERCRQADVPVMSDRDDVLDLLLVQDVNDVLGQRAEDVRLSLSRLVRPAVPEHSHG